ncbi:aminodeoxychorismate lyase [Anoxybacteroides tepidamans]|uniref:aminodeoxychorismate lyase n=1 Tax=Anoxybacteroides tepidamans TaxID=265948 RepID=UPI0004813138|nr:aminodeoxychorismate lyase [Anoxybacillus tepidamans]
MYVYVNGEIVRKEEARISPFDHGFMYGLGAFETFRTYKGHPFLLDDHIKRLNESLLELNISLTLRRDEVMGIINRLLEANQLNDAYIRFNVSAGVGDIGLHTGEYAKPTVIAYMKPLPLFFSAEKTCKILKTRRNSPEGERRLKSHHYLNNILGKREIGNDPQMEGVFLSEKGFLAEGIVSNLFWVRNGVVYTPSLETGILNGITRQFLLELLSVLKIHYEEGLYSVNELETAEEVFLTNSIQEIVPVSQVDEHSYLGKRGPLTQLLKKYYKHFAPSLWTRHELMERNDLTLW